MLKYPEPTPCPVHIASPRHHGLYATSSYRTSHYGTPFHPTALLPCEGTDNVDYTTELRAAIRPAKPCRRGSTRLGPGPIAIHEDVAEDGGLPSTVLPSTLQLYGNLQSVDIPLQQRPSATLAQRALRAPPGLREAAGLSPLHGSRRISAPFAKRQEHTDATSTGLVKVARSDEQKFAGLWKEPRRRTIFVPSEDTTILTIHPGLRPDLQTRSVNDDISCVEGLGSAGVTASTVRPAGWVRRVPRQSLAIAPKRVPLQTALKPPQDFLYSTDRAGRGPGKENVPPGVRAPQHHVCNTEDATGNMFTRFAHNIGPKAARPTASSFSRHAGSKKRSSLVRTDGQTKPMHTKSQCGTAAMNSKRPFLGDATKVGQQQSLGVIPDFRKRSTCTAPVAKVPSKLIAPVLSQAARRSGNQYPLLMEDISRPEMFEEAWLSDNEAAITQLINGLFQSANEREQCRHSNVNDLRRGCLQLYQEPSMSLLYKRLQASLLYGALSIPNHVISDCSRLRTDVGLRRKFISLWTRTYDLPLLRAAAEVVIGREVQAPSSSPAAMLHDDDQPRKEVRRELEAFLDSCLIRNEDTDWSQRLSANAFAKDQNRGSLEQDFGSPNWSLRRTMLRSLMIILLLDKAKELKVISGNLFCASSSLKSSGAVLQELFSLLLPSAGDITRPLTHLDYQVHHVQFPLDEYEYKIKSLATDLRDGVRLTRLVELLLYPPARLALQTEDITISMPTGEVLASIVEGRASWVLSQHLKFPCTGRSQKMYNAQIALSALHGVKGVDRIIKGIKAEDIVDGYREKTMAVLWGLVGKWGMERLVDVAELRKEIRRLKKQSKETAEIEGQSTGEDDIENDFGAEIEDGLQKHTHFLKSWANAVGRKYGVKVNNLTTSFSDGRVFERIVDEYGQQHGPHGASSAPCSLDKKLKALGCSSCFGE